MPTSRVISGMEITLLTRYVQAMGQPSFFLLDEFDSCLMGQLVLAGMSCLSTSHDDGRGRGHGHGHPYGLMVIIILILTLILIRSIFFLELTLHSQRPKTPAARGCLTLGWHGF